MRKIRVGIAGVGNCASSLVQALSYYSRRNADARGLMHAQIGGWSCSDIALAAAFDIDRRKVGQPLEMAVFSDPNCAMVFESELSPSGVVVEMAPALDGFATHMADFPPNRTFQLAKASPVNVAAILHDRAIDVLVCYMPVGADQAVRYYAEACLASATAMVNCTPSFIASNSHWAEAFRTRGVPLVGDDVKSQLGATIVHRSLARLFSDRGILLERTYQLNTGGNTDFMNMLARDRLVSKKLSKTNAVQSQLDVPLPTDDIHIGPSDYVPWLRDNKVCFLRMEGRGIGGAPVELELRLSVQDSPNSAGVVIDAVRCAALARHRGISGPLPEVSAYLMKSPPAQMRDSEAREQMESFIAGHDAARSAE